MGAFADAALAAGGDVVGVIPRALMDREIAHRGLTELRIVETMHERKATMAELADAFVALPGGLGTLEELFEIWTWGMLGLTRTSRTACSNCAATTRRSSAFSTTRSDEGFMRPAQRATTDGAHHAGRVVGRAAWLIVAALVLGQTELERHLHELLHCAAVELRRIEPDSPAVRRAR